jgi:hypothetical protein
MTSKVIVLLEDDVDGTKADETVEFGIDGTIYNIDLSDSNAKKLRSALDGYVSKARKVSGKRSSGRRVSTGPDLKAVRAWAKANGIEISERGRVSQNVLEQYHASGH